VVSLNNPLVVVLPAQLTELLSYQVMLICGQHICICAAFLGCLWFYSAQWIVSDSFLCGSIRRTRETEL